MNEHEAKSREDAEGRSASTVHRSVWDEENGASGRTKVSSETLQGELWDRSPDLFSPSLDSVYETAKTEQTNASCCPKDQQPKNARLRLVNRRKPKHKPIPWHAPRPPEEVEKNAEVLMVRIDEGDTSDLVGEDLRQQQQKDAELGAIMSFRLLSDEALNNEELQTDSELTKKLATKWEQQETYDGVVYRRNDSLKKGEPNFLVLGCEARAPHDIIYGSPKEEPDETYDSFVERIRERSVTAFAEARDSLEPKRFEVGQWVLYFNPRKLRGKQMKWIRQYEGPFLVVKVPSSVTAVIQRSAKARPKTVHIDKLKEFLGKPPKKWTVSGRSFVDEASPSVGAPFDGEASSPTDVVRGDDLSEVIRPLPMDKTDECLSDEGLENTGISLVDEECSSPEAVDRAEEVQLGLDEAQFVNYDDVLAEKVR